MARFKFQDYFSVLSKFLCFFGCVYQMIQINEIYFSYQTSTDIKYQDDNEFDQPSITVCYMKTDQVKNEYIDEMPISSYYSQLDFLNNLTIGHQFEYFEDYPKRIKDCSIYDNQLKLKKKCQVHNETKFDNTFYCFTLHSESDENIVLNDENKLFARILFYKSLSKNDFILIKLHAKNYQFDNIDRDILIIDHDNNITTSFVIYRKTRIIYKFIPKGKVCFEKGVDRQNCFKNCKNNEFIKSFNKYPATIFANKISSKFKFSNSNEYQKYNSSEKCSQKCELGVECYKEYFFVQAKHFKDENDDPDQYDYGIHFQFPTHPTTIYEISLKMQFEEYLCLIASILSLWFGFSILWLTQMFPIIYTKIMITQPTCILRINAINRYFSSDRSRLFKNKQMLNHSISHHY